MAALRTTVLMKTDLVGSTPLFRALLASDLQALMAEHRAFVAGLARENGGRIVRFGGDGYWLEFPSITAAARSAVAMQEALRLDQANKGADRLSMRVVIGVGDVGLQDENLIGDVLAVITRVESITPPDEIYLRSAARMILTAAEIQTAFVGNFTLKGLGDAIEIYRVEQRHRTRITRNACILVADLRQFTEIAQTLAVDDVERLLDALDTSVHQITAEAGGTVRFGLGLVLCDLP
jgi:class 3 adenylate cyclase